LLLSAVLRPGAAAPLLLDARVPPLSIDIFCRTALSSKPAARRCCGQMMAQTNRRTDGRTQIVSKDNKIYQTLFYKKYTEPLIAYYFRRKACLQRQVKQN